MKHYFLIALFLFLANIHSKSQSTYCNSFGKISALNNGFNGGNISVTGNRITIEAVVNNLGPNNGSSTISNQDVVSKHHTPSDINYLLRLDHAEIGTTNGFVKTDPICLPTIGETFHIAFVYDGSTLSFYRNGILMSQKSWTGNLTATSYPMMIGTFSAQDFDGITTTTANETLNGYINEVRIWNIARTQSELFEYKDKSLPNPQSTNGLIAYYQFTDLKNKTGNSNYDLSLLGSPQLNQTVPKCELGKDPCKQCDIDPSFTSVEDKCDLSKFHFTNTTQNVTKFAWDFTQSGTINSTQSETDYTFSQAGAYFVQLNVWDDYGCYANAGYNIIVPEELPVIATTSQDLCKGETITLNTNYTEPNTKYTWLPTNLFADNTTANPQITVDADTKISLDISTPEGCTKTGNIDLSIISASKFTVVPTETYICSGHETILTATGGDSYVWKDIQGDIIGTNATIKVNPIQTKQYAVDITSSRCNEHASLPSIVNLFPIETITLTQSNIISCLNNKTTIIVNGGISSFWTPNNNLVVDGKNAIVEPQKTETYSTIITDKNGCTYSKEITIVADLNASNSKFFIPSAFTPNGDGKNDVFRIQTNIYLNRYKLTIFNRYGQLVFQTFNPNNGWNGMINNSPQPSGTFIYELFANSSSCGEYHKKGTVVLIR